LLLTKSSDSWLSRKVAPWVRVRVRVGVADWGRTRVKG